MMKLKFAPFVALFAILAAITLIGGCQDVKEAVVSVAPGGEATGEKLPPRVYPADMTRGQPFDIEIIRDGRKRIRLDNRTAQTYHNVQLWLNGQYGCTLDEIPIGAGRDFHLVDFVNQHGEQFPVGSVLEPEKARTVVLADLILDGQMHKLYVRLPRNWQQP